MIGKDGTHRFVGRPAGRVLANHPQVVVLHWIMVAVELEVTAHGLEVLGFQRLLQRCLVLDLTFYIAYGAVDQQRGIVALRGVERR